MSLSIGFPASSLLINGQTAAAATTASKTLIAQTATQAAAEDKEGDKKDDVNVDMNEIGASGSSSEGLSVTTANLLKRLAALQQQLEKIQQQMQAAENASYPTPEAKTTAVMGFQSQVSSITGAIQQVSAQLMKEMSKSGGVNTTA